MLAAAQLERAKTGVPRHLVAASCGVDVWGVEAARRSPRREASSMLMRRRKFVRTEPGPGFLSIERINELTI